MTLKPLINGLKTFSAHHNDEIMLQKQACKQTLQVDRIYIGCESLKAFLKLFLNEIVVATSVLRDITLSDDK